MFSSRFAAFGWNRHLTSDAWRHLESASVSDDLRLMVVDINPICSQQTAYSQWWSPCWLLCRIAMVNSSAFNREAEPEPGRWGVSDQQWASSGRWYPTLCEIPIRSCNIDLWTSLGGSPGCCHLMNRRPFIHSFLHTGRGLGAVFDGTFNHQIHTHSLLSWFWLLEMRLFLSCLFSTLSLVDKALGFYEELHRLPVEASVAHAVSDDEHSTV